MKAANWIIWAALFSLPAVWLNSQTALVLQPQTGHSGEIRALTWSPCGGFFASAGEDGTVRLWNAEGTQLRSWHAHAGSPRGIAFSPDSKAVLSWNSSYQFNDVSVQIRDLSGELLREWRGRPGEILRDVTWVGPEQIALGLRGEVRVITRSGSHSTRLRLRNDPQSPVEVTWSGDRLFARAGGTVTSWQQQNRSWREQRDYAPWPRIPEPATDIPPALRKLATEETNLQGLFSETANRWLILTSSNHIWIADASGKILRRIANIDNKYLHHMQVGPEGQLVIPTGSHTVAFWSRSGAHVRLLPPLAGPLLASGIEADGFFLLHADKVISRYDWNGIRKPDITLEQEVTSISMMPDGWLGIARNQLVLFTPEGRLNGSLAIDVGHISVAQVIASRNEAWLGVASPSTDQIWRICLIERKVLQSWRSGEHSGGVWAIVPSPIGQTVLSGDRSYNVMEWGPSGQPIRTFVERRSATTHDHAVTALDWNRRGRIASGSMDGRVKIWEPDGRFVVSVAMNSIVDQIRFTGCATALWIATRDNRLTLMDLTGMVLLTLIHHDTDWIVYDHLGRFDASFRGADLVAAISGTEARSIDSYAGTFNRPDLFWGQWPDASDDLVRQFRQIHERRLQRMGWEDPFSTPVQLPQLTQQASIENGMATIAIEANDPTSPLVSLNIFLNGVPLLGANGHKFAAPATQVNFSHSFRLRPGDNLIEADVTNTWGLTSPRAAQWLHHSAPDNPRWFFVGLGVSTYANAELNLQFADKDITDFAALLDNAISASGGTLKQFVRLNEQVTPDVIAPLRQFLAAADTGDIVVLMIAGHGAYADDPADGYFFLPHNVDPARLTATGISWSTIEEILLATPANRKLLLMDTCASGELDQAALTEAALSPASGLVARSSRALRRLPDQPTAHGGSQTPTTFQRPRPPIQQRDRFIYADLLRRTGAVVISSSRGNELSYESTQLGNGLFTAGLIHALQNAETATLSLDELFEQTLPFVMEHSHYRQTPVIDRDNPRTNIFLPTLNR